MTKQERIQEQMNIANEILRQLGQNKFLAMTGSKNLVATDCGLRMDLTANIAGVNRLEITYHPGNDRYSLWFYKMTINRKTWDCILSKEQRFADVYGEDLQRIFTQVTGLDTHL